MKSFPDFSLYFREIQMKFPRYHTTLLHEEGLSLPQYALLSLLLDGAIPMTEASAKLHISKPAVTSLVDRLERNKWIKRTPHTHDRRVHVLQIQPAGEKIVRQTQDRILDLVLKAWHQFDEQERKIITQFYNRLSQVLDEKLKRPRKR